MIVAALSFVSSISPYGRAGFRFLSTFLLIFVFGSAARGQQARVLEFGTPETAGMDQGKLKEAVQLYRSAVEKDQLYGAVLMVARHGRVVLYEPIGWKHKAYRLPMEKDTLFRMASNTKPLIATASLILVEEGKLRLQDPVAKHIASFANWRSRTITLFHLLTHTAGFRIEPILLPFDDKSATKPTLLAAVDKFGGEGPAVEPGTSYSYSNAGFNTIGALIEVASGMGLEEFLKKRVYDPLGMTDSLNHEDPDELNRMATVYRGSREKNGAVEFKQGFTPGDPPDFPIVRASGGMISTALDYAKFLQMCLSGGSYGKVRILSPESIKNATTPHVKSGESGAYGLGWMVAADGTYSHGGSDGTMAWVDPARDLFGLVFTQCPGGINPAKEFRKLVEDACNQ